MFVSNIMWALHDLYRDGNAKVVRFVNKVFGGWHVLKWPMIIIYYLSGVAYGIWLCLNYIDIKTCLLQILISLVALVCAKQSAFEGAYCILGHGIKPFYWLRSWLTVFKCWDWEYLFHNCFRLHWSEASAVLLFGLYLIWRL